MPVEPIAAVVEEGGAVKHAPPVKLWVGVAFFIYLLLVGVSTIGTGFKWLSGGADGAAAIFAFASNPVVGVILGTLATALVQSSSTVTSVIVGLVAGGVPVAIAVPMIMGSNMGTTITNTIVSLGNLRQRGAFRASFEAATVHDFFNLYSIVLFLPLEILFHPLERMGKVLAAVLSGGPEAAVGGFNPVGAATDPLGHGLRELLGGLLPQTPAALLTIAAGVACIITAVLCLGSLLRAAMTGRAKGIIDTAIGRGPFSGIASGTLVTVLVQSSSTTTSLVVPLAGAGVLSTRQIYPFTLGANIGTCVTALLAATAITGPNQELALQIALVHLLFNMVGVLAFTLVPGLRELPIQSSSWLGRRVEGHRGWAFGYIGSLFFLVPGVVFGAEYLVERRQPTRPVAVCAQEDSACLQVEVKAVERRLE